MRLLQHSVSYALRLDALTKSDFIAFVLFTQTWVGVMLMKQPFFVGGIEDVEAAKGSAFGAAGTFFFTFVVSMMYMIRQARSLTTTVSSSSSHSSVGSFDSQRRNPFFDRPGPMALFHDYDPVDSTIPQEELDSPGVFS